MTTQEKVQNQRWLPFLKTYRTLCIAPNPDFLRLLDGILLSLHSELRSETVHA